MLDFCDIEKIVTIVATVTGGIILPALGWMWVRIIKPLMKLVDSQDDFRESIQEIKSEIKTNGGKSIKDTLGKVSETVERIETRQKVIDQRTKAALHYSGVPLFETDKHGRLVWSNTEFNSLLGEHNSLLEGYDWLSLIKDEEQDETLDHFRSCLEMNRKFSKQTELDDGTPIRMVGYPLKISNEEHGGYVVSVNKLT